MSDQIHEQELPGIGRRYSVQADGGEVSVVIHHSGRRDLYLAETHGRTPPAVACLSDDQARRRRGLPGPEPVRRPRRRPS